MQQQVKDYYEVNQIFLDLTPVEQSGPPKQLLNSDDDTQSSQPSIDVQLFDHSDGQFKGPSNEAGELSEGSKRHKDRTADGKQQQLRSSR